MTTSSVNFWHKFFIGAGILPDSAAAYAASFNRNRITSDMICDLNKDYLRDLGIKLLGDIIAILRHAEKTQFQVQKKVPAKKVPMKKLRSPSRSAETSNDNAVIAQQLKLIQETLKMSESAASTPGASHRNDELLNGREVGSKPVEDDTVADKGQDVPIRDARKEISKSEKKVYYGTAQPGSVFTRLGRRIEKSVSSNKCAGKESIFTRLGQRENAQENVCPPAKPTLQVQPKIYTISAGVLSQDSSPPSKERPVSEGVFSSQRSERRSLNERLGKRADRLSVNAAAIIRLLK